MTRRDAMDLPTALALLTGGAFCYAALARFDRGLRDQRCMVVADRRGSVLSGRDLVRRLVIPNPTRAEKALRRIWQA